jgi:hypothetical protein
MIHLDDTIYDIKIKIIQAIQSLNPEKNLNPNEMYLFSEFHSSQTAIEISENILLQTREKTITKQMFEQWLINRSISKEEQNKSTSHLIDKSTAGYFDEDFAKINLSSSVQRKPLGIRFPNDNLPLLFPVNPFETIYEIEHFIDDAKPESHQKDVLLDYGTVKFNGYVPVINVCFFSDLYSSRTDAEPAIPF